MRHLMKRHLGDIIDHEDNVAAGSKGVQRRVAYHKPYCWCEWSERFHMLNGVFDRVAAREDDIRDTEDNHPSVLEEDVSVGTETQHRLSCSRA